MRVEARSNTRRPNPRHTSDAQADVAKALEGAAQRGGPKGPTPILQQTEGISLTEDQLRQLLRTAAGHRCFPLYWLTAMTGLRLNEVLGVKWSDIDMKKKRLHLNRGLVAGG